MRICTGFPRPSCEHGASVCLIGMTLMTGGEISEEDGLLQACVTHQSAMTSVVRIDHSFSDRSPALWRHRICGFTGICHCTGLKGLNALLSAIFVVEYFIPQTY